MSESAHDEARGDAVRARHDAGRARSDSGRHETEEERADRKWGDLLQEIRVAQTGVQILFGFLLTVVFTPRYAQLEQADRTIYIVTVVLGASATGALIGPVSLHRIVAGRRVKEQAVVWASRLTLAGLVLLLATMTASLLLVLRVATHDDYVPWLVTGIVAWYLFCWFAVPMWVRGRHTAP
ncbi:MULTISPECIES: DUF6328 family protein [unclassified Streptomyces]|uniref:DUF6328 family protein n=1 Tax=unclassified Streptomyces TaxID=2593676 RepID=UPI0011CDB8C0|nr:MULTISPECIES: DUF6328 family protein [unclassified Streptomyces]TXS69938.1 hypothetical protein EAO69_25410 [Streptomyces sp. me109]